MSLASLVSLADSVNPDASSQPWMSPALVAWCQLVLDSYRHWVGRELIERAGDAEAQALACFEAPWVLVSHGAETDPILKYGNRVALELWEMEWAEFTRTPSRCTAEPVAREERERMLQQAAQRGYVDGYRGVRVSRSGRRFLVDNAIVWNVVDRNGVKLGQAAMFTAWTPLA